MPKTKVNPLTGIPVARASNKPLEQEWVDMQARLKAEESKRIEQERQKHAEKVALAQQQQQTVLKGKKEIIDRVRSLPDTSDFKRLVLQRNALLDRLDSSLNAMYPEDVLSAEQEATIEKEVESLNVYIAEHALEMGLEPKKAVEYLAEL